MAQKVCVGYQTAAPDSEDCHMSVTARHLSKDSELRVIIMDFIQQFHTIRDRTQHVALVFYADPRAEIYIDGKNKLNVQDPGYIDTSNSISSATLKMSIGRGWSVRAISTATPKHMEFDELCVFDWPLSRNELAAFFP